MTTWNRKVLGIALLSAVTLAAQADVLLYDNTENQLGTVLNFPNGQEIGDQIFLANYTADPYLTGFSFEYYSPDSSWSGTVTADVRFYQNDGPPFNGYNAPGTLFYDTGAFNVLPPLQIYGGTTNSAVLAFSSADLYNNAAMNMNPSFMMPSNMTMSVTFQGLSGSESVGLPSFGPPHVGYNYGDYWVNNGGTWQLETSNNNGQYSKVAFAMQLTATNQPVPEPTAMGVAAVGAAVLAGFARWRRHKA
jgi:hypothetical protein